MLLHLYTIKLPFILIKFRCRYSDYNAFYQKIVRGIAKFKSDKYARLHGIFTQTILS